MRAMESEFNYLLSVFVRFHLQNETLLARSIKANAGFSVCATLYSHYWSSIPIAPSLKAKQITVRLPTAA